MSKEKVDVYSIVTDRIIDLLEQGVVPWHKPWAGGGTNQFPVNFVSKKAYRGLNVWLLSCAGFSSPFWVSYKQATELGGQVRKGEKSTMVVYWKMLETIDNVTKEKKTIPMLRYYNVFNVSQCDGLNIPVTDEPQITFNPIEEAEKIVANMQKKPVITHVDQSAYYRRDSDVVNMPKKETFKGEAEYYSTLFHELTHATGHESRLGRFQNAVSKFGDSNYAKEELVAEMGASYLCAVAGIVDRTIDNSAAYIASWLKRLKNDKKLVVSAAGKAHAACDFILGVSA